MPETIERYERFGCKAEASSSEQLQQLIPRPNHESQPKWIAEIGRVDPRRLGKRKNYDYRMELVTIEGTRDWLSEFEDKPDNEPGRYAIAHDKLHEFNDNLLLRISINPRG